MEFAPGVTVLVVLVPEAEPLLGPLRWIHDRSAAEGMPSHVTIVAPFAPLAALDAAAMARLAAAIGRVGRFTARFARAQRFGDTLLWLAPDPSQPFVALTRGVVEAFPDYLPYAGRHAEIVPHMTIADDAAPGSMPGLESAIVGAELATHVDEVQLFAREAGRWVERRRFSLGL